MNIASTKKNEVVSGLLARNILIKRIYGIFYLVDTYKSCIIEYLHKQQYLIGKYNALLKIYLMHVLQCPSDWGTYYTLMNVGYAHTI